MDRTTRGWRERKREQTGRRIAESGLRLMLERGFEATTLEAIAEASEIAPRTLFHYYKSKEDILLTWQTALPDDFRTALLAQPRDQSPWQAVRGAHLELIAGVDSGQARSVARVIRSSDRLRAANQAKFIVLEEVGFETLRRMWPDPSREAGLRAVSMAATGALRLALELWAADEAPSSLSGRFCEIHDALCLEFAAAGDPGRLP